MKTHIIGAYTYQYQGKVWTLFDEDGAVVATIPKGGKLFCLQTGIQTQRPTIYQAAQAACARHPEADGFIWRAAELLLNGHVYEARAENQIGEVARVLSDSFKPHKPFDRHAGYDRDGFFSIQEQGFLTCNSDSYHSEYGPKTNGGWKLCKHIMAVMLAKASHTPLQVRTLVHTSMDNLSLDELNQELFA